MPELYRSGAAATGAFSALADPTRRAIFEALAHAPRSVGELAERFPVSRPAVSQHLRVLQDVALVSMQRAGTRHIYSVDREGLASVRRYLDELYTQALGNFKALAEATYQRGDKP
jgi:DNA-binding transcriptional ArsR family regulator